MCRQIAVKSHLLPLEVIGEQPMVSIANTVIGNCGISKCCGYLAILGRCLAHTLHLPLYFTIPCHSLGHQQYLLIASNI